MTEAAADPEPPTNVRVRFVDGTVVPCELSYEGWEDGAHQWRAVVAIVAPAVARERRAPLTAELLIEKLPAKTAVNVQVVVR